MKEYSQYKIVERLLVEYYYQDNWLKDALSYHLKGVDLAEARKHIDIVMKRRVLTKLLMKERGRGG